MTDQEIIDMFDENLDMTLAELSRTAVQSRPQRPSTVD